MKKIKKALSGLININVVLLLAAINLVVFYYIFRSFMYADEFYYTYKLSMLHGWGVVTGIFELCMTSAFAPVSLSMNWVCYSLFKLWMPGYFIPNYFLSIINGILVYILTNKMLKDQRAALFAAVFFACFPAGWEALSLSTVMHLAYGAFIFSALISWIDENYRLSYLMLIMSCLTHETGLAVVPAILLFYEWQVKGRGLPEIIKKMRYIIAIAAVFLVFKIIRISVYHTDNYTGVFHLGWHFFRNYFGLIGLLLLSVNTYYRAVKSLPSILFSVVPFLKAGVFFLIATPTVIFMRTDKGISRLLILSILTILVPYSLIDLPIVSRYLYQASMFFSVLMGYLFYIALKQNVLLKRSMIVFLLIFLIGNFFLSIATQKVFYSKKEVRRDVLTSVQRYCPSIANKEKLLFIDIPFKTVELKYMLYLWYKNDGFDVDTINPENYAFVQSNMKKNISGYDRVFIFNVKSRQLEMTKSHK
jgi:hypothetical protein